MRISNTKDPGANQVDPAHGVDNLLFQGTSDLEIDSVKPTSILWNSASDILQKYPKIPNDAEQTRHIHTHTANTVAVYDDQGGALLCSRSNFKFK